MAYKRLGADFVGQVAANGGFEVTYQLAEIYGDQKVYEATGGQAGTNKQWSDFSLGQVAMGAGLGVGMHFIPQIASGIKSMWTARTADNGVATRLEVPIAQVAETAKPLLGSLADSTGLQILRKAGGVIKLGLKEIALPKALSLTSKQASEWLLKQVDVMKGYLDGLKVSLREKAAMAINLRNDLVAAARNAIYDTRVTKWLNEQSPLWIMEEIIAKLRKTLSGDALHKKIVELATSLKDMVIGGKSERGLERVCKFDGDCFVAGTLVHTDKGLVPIEQLKVGDMVLSRPENDPNAPNEYKRVLSTFKSAEKKKITYVSYDFFDINNIEKNGRQFLFCTEDHPFWVKNWAEKININWLPASYLTSLKHHCLETYDSSPAIIMSSYDIEKGLWASKNMEVAYMLDSAGEEPDGWIDFRSDRPKNIIRSEAGLATRLFDRDDLHDSEPVIDLTHLSDDDAQIIELSHLIEEADGAYIPYMATVYNIEVEDFHTYYVGHAGIWVHNTDGCFSELYPDTFNKAKDLNPQYNVKPLNDSALHKQLA
ncbi:MAG: hypothetical protein U1E94_05285 [Agitococcus sp.]